MAEHHIPLDWLSAYAIGEVDEPTATLIAAHLTFCAECRSTLDELELLGGALLDSIDPGDENQGLTADVSDVVSMPKESINEPTRIQAPEGSLSKIAPRPLIDFVYAKSGVTEIERLPWQPYAPGIKRAILTKSGRGSMSRLIKAKPGSQFPHHDHGSDEMTIILQGAYRDHTATYAVGDVQCIGENQPHRPAIVGDEVCIGFVVSEKPPIPTGIIAKLVQKLIG